MDPVPLSLDEAVALAEHFVDVSKATPLYGDADQNFRITARDGCRYVLKISTGKTKEVRHGVDLQQRLLECLDGGPQGVRCQRPIVTRSGDSVVYVREGKGQSSLAWMVEFVEGQLLADVPDYPKHLLRDIGRSVARVDLALMGFDHPAAHRHIQWDLAQLANLLPMVETVQDPDRRELLSRCMDRACEDILPALAQCPHGVIHNDGGNQHNMLVKATESGNWRICGLIDFGDAVFTARVCGLGIAAAYASFGTERPAEAIVEVLRGYHQALPLSAMERSLVPGLAMARLAMSVAISSHRLLSEPDNDYLQISAQPAWQVLAAMDAGELERAIDLLGDIKP
jgi:Ser/Thr protein kinase RdoA (MazF antagonist)